MKKFALYALAILGTIIILKVIFAVMSALVGFIMFFGVLALIGIGVITVLRFLSKSRSTAL